ncbi:MAG: hypothetical protein QM765_19030 [Myxococcales bacterium]
MRLLVLAMVLTLASPALAAEVRVKSKHEKAQLQGMSQDAYKVGAEETLRAGVIGPSTVKVTLRRVGEGKLPSIPVKLMRDGREVGKLAVGGKLAFAIAGDAALAGPPVVKTLDIPAGPHTLFVEVGAGKGLVMVSFDEAQGTPVVAKAEEAKPEPKVAVAKAPAGKLEDTEPKKGDAVKAEAKAEPKKKGEPAKAEAKVDPKKKGEPAKAEANTGPTNTGEPAKAEEKAGPKAEETKLAQAEESKPAPSKLEDSEPEPAKPAPSKLEDSEPVPTPKAEVAKAGKLEETEPEVVATDAQPSDVPAGPRRLHVFLGPRLGGAAQVQLGAIGPAVGLSFRWAVLGGSTRNGTKGLLVGLSADMLRYSVALQLPASSPLGESSPVVTAISVPILLEASYSFGNPDQAQLTPYAGIAVGLSAGNVKLETPVEESQGFVGFAAGAHIGLEIPIGDNRLGVEARYLWSQLGGEGAVKDLDVGGVMLQASWRFGI